MRSNTEENNGRPRAETQAEEPDFKWAVEYLVRERGQRQAAAMLGVNRKTVALALRRDRLTSRMNHAVQTLIAKDDPVNQEVMPLDRIDSQIRFLLDSTRELDDLIDALTLRVEALEEAQARAETEAQAEAEADADEVATHEDDVTEVEGQQVEPVEALEPGPEQAGGRFGWWRR